MRKLYYKIIIRKPYETYNEGFIKIEIGDKRRLESVEGIFTNDFLTMEKFEEQYIFKYYIWLIDKNIWIEEPQIELGNDQILLPPNYELHFFRRTVQLITKTQLKDNISKKICDIQLEEFKKNFISQKEQ